MSDDTPSRPTKELLADALRVLEKTRARVEALRAERSEPLAIVGIGCRLPGGANGPDTLWKHLLAGDDLTSEVPRERWNAESFHDPDPEAPGKTVTKRGGFVEGIEEFDPGFFGLAPREAPHVDPQQRLLLATAWEALEHAGISPTSLRGTSTGVFVGISTAEYRSHLLENLPRVGIVAAHGTGTAASAAPGRLSYSLGLQGPSLAIDTACSSSLVATHLACQSLRRGESDCAIVGGVNALMHPLSGVVFSQARMLSPDGRCKAFSAGADGYGRAEGCAVIVLKRLGDARRDGDRILAEIVGSAVNQDGASGGLTVPNGPMQVAVIRDALEAAGMRAQEIDVVEAHGTGTALGDPLEMGALAEVFGASHTSARPLFVSSVKANCGHLEAAAGIAGLLRLVLQLTYGALAPHVRFGDLTPHVPWDDIPVRLPDAEHKGAGSPRAGGVSSFGFTGTNAHVVCRATTPTTEITPSPDAPQLITLSARSEQALDVLVQRWIDHLGRHPDLRIADVAYTAARGRAAHRHRLAVIASSTSQLRTLLESGAGVRGVASVRALTRVACSDPAGAEKIAALGLSVVTTEPIHLSVESVPDEVAFASQAWVDGCAIDLASLTTDGARIVTLPTYPFETRRFTVPRNPSTCFPPDEVGHPLLGVPHRSPLHDGWVFPVTLEPGGPSGYDAVSAGLVLEAAIAGVARAAGVAVAALEHVTVGPIPALGPRPEMQTLVRPDDRRDRVVEVWVRTREGPWMPVLRGDVGADVDTPSAPGASTARTLDLEPHHQAHAEVYHLHPVLWDEVLAGTGRVACISGVVAVGRCGPRVSVEVDGGDVHVVAPGGDTTVYLKEVAFADSEPLPRGCRMLYALRWFPSRPRAVKPSAVDVATSPDGAAVRLTRACLAGVPPAEDATPESRGVWGWLRCVGAEEGEVVNETAPGPDGVVEPRIVPASGAQGFTARGTWLVTGGGGGVGTHVRRWLLERGAERVIVAGRGATGPDAVVTDVTDADAVGRLIDRLVKDSPPLRGVVHAAGVLDDALSTELDESRVRAVVAPKVDGAESLARATEALALDALVFVSSSVALLGNPGQAAYAAANGYLVGLAEELRSRGRPAVAVAFGPWADTGMSARTRHPSWTEYGIRPLVPEDALEALGAALQGDDACD